jgi:hypothetical protein
VDADVVRQAEEEGEDAGQDHARRQEVPQVDTLGNEAAEIGGQFYKHPFRKGKKFAQFFVLELWTKILIIIFLKFGLNETIIP